MRTTLAALAAGLVLAAPALAAPAAPFDGGAPGGARATTLPLPTGLLDLGTDLTLFGVDPVELSTAGPTASSSSSSSGSMLIVDDDHLDCPNAQFTTIQAAVTAAPPGATIKVCR